MFIVKQSQRFPGKSCLKILESAFRANGTPLLADVLDVAERESCEVGAFWLVQFPGGYETTFDDLGLAAAVAEQLRKRGIEDAQVDAGGQP